MPTYIEEDAFDHSPRNTAPDFSDDPIKARVYNIYRRHAGALLSTLRDAGVEQYVIAIVKDGIKRLSYDMEAEVKSIIEEA